VLALRILGELNVFVAFFYLFRAILFELAAWLKRHSTLF